MVAVAVAEHQQVDLPLAARPQQRHDDALAGVGVARERRPGVVDQQFRLRAHQHRGALADVEHHQLEAARQRMGHGRPQHRQRSGTASSRRRQGSGSSPSSAAASPPATAHAGAAGTLQTASRPRRQPLQQHHQRRRRGRCRLPQPRQHHAGQCQRRHHQRDPRNGHQVGDEADQRHLLKERQRQRRQPERGDRLRAQHRRTGVPARRAAPPAAAAGRCAIKQADRGERQPEAGLQQRPGVEHRHHRGGSDQHQRPRPVRARARSATAAASISKVRCDGTPKPAISAYSAAISEAARAPGLR